MQEALSSLSPAQMCSTAADPAKPAVCFLLCRAPERCCPGVWIHQKCTQAPTRGHGTYRGLCPSSPKSSFPQALPSQNRAVSSSTGWEHPLPTRLGRGATEVGSISESSALERCFHSSEALAAPPLLQQQVPGSTRGIPWFPHGMCCLGQEKCWNFSGF